MKIVTNKLTEAYDKAAWTYADIEATKKLLPDSSPEVAEMFERDIERQTAKYKGMLEAFKLLDLLDDYAEWHEKYKDHYTL